MTRLRIAEIAKEKGLNQSSGAMPAFVPEAKGTSPAAQVFQRYLFKPLDMDHTGLPSLTSVAIPDPHGYSLLLPGGTQPVDATNWNPSWAWAAGSAISTLHDLKIWAKALATGQLLSAAMQHERLELVPESPSLFRYGLGIVDILGFPGHTSQLPGFQSFMGYRPKDGATMIVLAFSRSTAQSQSAARAFIEIDDIVGMGIDA